MRETNVPLLDGEEDADRDVSCIVNRNILKKKIKNNENIKKIRPRQFKLPKVFE